MDKFVSLSELLIALKNYDTKNILDPRLANIDGKITLKAPSGQNELTSSEGGYLVGGEIISPLLHALQQKSVLFAGSRKFYSSSPRVNTGLLPFVQETSRAESSFQLKTYWTNEGATKNSAKYTIGLAECKLNKLYATLHITEELWSDAAGLQSVLDEFISDTSTGSLVWQIEGEMLWGNGSTMFGIMGPSTNGTIGVAVADPIDEVTLNAFNDALAPALQKTAQWFVSNENFVDINAINFTNDGDKFYDVNGNMYIYGHKVNVMEQMVAPYDILLGDPSQYAVALKSGPFVTSAVTVHVKFLTDEKTIRWGLRINGKSYGTAYSLEDGTSVGSWVIPDVTPVDMSSSSSSSSYVEGWSSSSSSTEIFSHSSESSPSSYSTQSLSTEITNLSSSSTSSYIENWSTSSKSSVSSSSSSSTSSSSSSST